MNTETLTQTRVGHLFAGLMAKAMESRLRYRFFGPEKILEGVDDLRGRAVLEVGCGTGFFTMPAAFIVGDHGSLVASDILQESVDLVSKKVQEARLVNVTVIKADATDTKLDDASFETVLLFGVIPAPMIALNRLLTEMHRLLKLGGTLAVWPRVPGYLPHSVMKSGLFTLRDKRNGVLNFSRL